MFCSISFWKTTIKRTVLKSATIWLPTILVAYWLSLDRYALNLPNFQVKLIPLSLYIILPVLFSIISVSLSYRLKWWVSIPLMYVLTGTSFILIDLIALLTFLEEVATFKIGYYGFYDYIFLFGLLGAVVNATTKIAFKIGTRLFEEKTRDLLRPPSRRNTEHSLIEPRHEKEVNPSQIVRARYVYLMSLIHLSNDDADSPQRALVLK